LGSALIVMSLMGPALAADTPEELKELDKLQGYDSLPGEKGLKKAMENVPDQPIETLIVWSEAKPTSGAAPLTVAFTADKPPSAANPVFTWQFGDGSAPATGAAVSHTFAKPGTYKVLLKVTDASGDLGEDELRIKVTP
jgi:hypothetical protein